MNLPSRISIVVLHLVIGAAIYKTGRFSTPSSSSDKSSAGQTETRSNRGTTENSRDGSNSGAERMGRPKTSSKLGSSSDKLARLASIAQIEDPLTRKREMLAYIDRLGPSEFEAAVTHFLSLEITDRRLEEYEMLLSAWAKIDPLAALDDATAYPENDFSTATILTTWASTDPDAALLWADANHQGNGANPYFAGIIRGIVATNPDRAQQILIGMPPGVEREESLSVMVSHFLSQGNDAALAWITSIDDGSLRSEAYSNWASKDQQAATDSLATLPSGDIRSTAMQGIISSIARTNPYDAALLLVQFPNDVNDHVVETLIERASNVHPSFAMSQFAKIQDESLRDLVSKRTLRQWHEKDPAKARSWIRSNPLPQSVKQELSDIIDPIR